MGNSISETTEVLAPETNVNGWKRLFTSRLHEYHYIIRDSKLSFISRIEFIRSKRLNLSAHVCASEAHGGVAGATCAAGPPGEAPESRGAVAGRLQCWDGLTGSVGWTMDGVHRNGPLGTAHGGRMVPACGGHNSRYVCYGLIPYYVGGK